MCLITTFSMIASAVSGVKPRRLVVAMLVATIVSLSVIYFWRRLWPESERPKIRVWNPPAGFRPVERRATDGPPRLTYFSWPFDRADFYPQADLLDGFIELFQRLLAAGSCRLTVRAHPLENPDDLFGRWRRRHGALPPGIELSQRRPLDEVLAETDVAVMFRSTVMLDCFASGIPMVIPAWPELGWRDRLEGVRGVRLAADFDELAATLEAWIREPPRMDREESRAFLRPAGEGRDDLARWLAELAGGGET